MSGHGPVHAPKGEGDGGGGGGAAREVVEPAVEALDFPKKAEEVESAIVTPATTDVAMGAVNTLIEVFTGGTAGGGGHGGGSHGGGGHGGH